MAGSLPCCPHTLAQEAQSTAAHGGFSPPLFWCFVTADQGPTLPLLRQRQEVTQRHSRGPCRTPIAPRAGLGGGTHVRATLGSLTWSPAWPTPTREVAVPTEVLGGLWPPPLLVSFPDSGATVYRPLKSSPYAHAAAFFFLLWRKKKHLNFCLRF